MTNELSSIDTKQLEGMIVLHRQIMKHQGVKHRDHQRHQQDVAAIVAELVARRVATQAVYDLAERMDCSMLVARADLEADAYSAITGEPLDYGRDWRNG
jgi:surfactin synthase thioesterase subunit